MYDLITIHWSIISTANKWNSILCAENNCGNADKRKFKNIVDNIDNNFGTYTNTQLHVMF